MTEMKDLFCVRTVTCFLPLDASDMRMPSSSSDNNDNATGTLDNKIQKAAALLRQAEQTLVKQGYLVQTLRIATNPFGEWLSTTTSATTDDDASTTTTIQQLKRLDALLALHSIEFCSLGPATCIQQVTSTCPQIIRASPRFSCSVNLKSADAAMAGAAAACILQNAGCLHPDNTTKPLHMQDGLGNFRFCVASSCRDFIPFFPAAKCSAANGAIIATKVPQPLQFAVGLENGALARHLLTECKSIANVRTTFRTGMAAAVEPVQAACHKIAAATQSTYMGMDTSLNPSLDKAGSVASALEALDEVLVFGGHGTVAAAAVVTECLQSLAGIKLVGYCGLMLPLCEDVRLAELASAGKIRIADLLSISNVCGVGVDTVPIPGDCSVDEIAALLLDVAGVADRWNKSLSCRVFPVPGKQAGDWTTFDFPHMLNARVMSLT